MNILITGGCGYIGSLLYDHLSKTHNVKSYDLELFGNPNIPNIKAPLVDITTIEKNLDELDFIINLASVSSVSLCRDNRYMALDTNVTQFLKLVDCLNPKTKIIYASSSCVYGSGVECTELTPLDLMDDLAITKGMLDSYMSISKRDFIGLRLGSVNGWSPNRRTDLMINSMDLCAKENLCVRVFNGRASRPIIGTNDLVSAIDAIIESKKFKPGIYNLHSFNIKILNAAKAVAKFHGVPLETLSDAPSFDFGIDSSKFSRTFKWKAQDTILTVLDSLQKESVLYTSRL